jgi:hypothetical protein
VVEKFEGAAHGKNVVMNKKRRISEGAKNLSLSLSLSLSLTRQQEQRDCVCYCTTKFTKRIL